MQNTSPIQLPFTTSHAFIIGIDDYQHVSPLSTAVNDARAIAQRLEAQHGFSVHPPLLNASHQELRKLLTETIPAMVQADDRLLFYFAGHGIALDSEEGPNGYLVAADTKPGQEDTLVSMQSLHDALTGLPCRHGLLVLDCCFSGAFKWSSGFRDVIFDLPKVIYEERFWRYCKDPAWQVITSAAHDQKAVDIITNQSLGLREDNDGDNSPFAASLLRALDGEGDVVPAGEGDGVMTATELYSYLRDSVETRTTEHAKRQSPSIFNLQRHDKGEFIFLNPRHRFNLPPTPDRNPFMGLASYNEADANLFFGRDRVVEALLEKVKQQSLLVVSGASGTGKSSVIKAGLLPTLRKQGYTILPVIRPGQEPMKSLADILSPTGGGLRGRNTESPTLPPPAPPPKGDQEGPLVLVVDQYEELITQCLHPEEREQFEQQLAAWLHQYPELRIILSVRADFEPQFESEILAQWWQRGRYVVPAFSLEEVREVITRPAAQAVLFYEPEDLIEQLGEEVSQAPGALPLLSFTLSELYHAYLKSGREDRSLSGADYEQLGGVIGALRTRADAEYEALSRAEQSSMRKLMLRMVSLEGGELAGKRVYAEELEFSDPAESKRLQRIANRLVDARLLLKGKDGQGRTYVEPAHDALVRAWARLWEWIKGVGEEKISLQYKLSQAVNDYHELLTADPKQARNLLWNNNPRLDLLRVELEGKDHGLNKQEEEFVRASVRRRTARRRTSWGIAIAVMVGLAVLAIIAWNQKIIADANEADAKAKTEEVRDSSEEAARQRIRANKEAASAMANYLSSESNIIRAKDPTIAFRLAEKALSYDSSSNLAVGALLSAFYAASFNEQAGLFYRQYSGTPPSFEHADHISDELLPKHQQLEQQYEEGLWQTIYAPDDRSLLLSVQYPLDIPTLRLIMPSGRESEELILGNYSSFSPLSFHPSSQYVAIPQQNQVQIRTTEQFRIQGRFFCAVPVREAQFDQEGLNLLAKASDDRMYQWPLRGYPIAKIEGGRFHIQRLYVSADNRTIVLDFSGNNYEIWKYKERSRQYVADNKSQPPTLDQFSQFAAPGWLRASSSYITECVDRTQYTLSYPEDRLSITIEELSGSRRSVTLSGHTKEVVSVAVAPDGQNILTSSGQEIKIWDWQGRDFITINEGGYAGFMPDGHAVFLYPWEGGGEDSGDAQDRNVLKIFPINSQQILGWVNKQSFDQLSDSELRKYGLAPQED